MKSKAPIIVVCVRPSDIGAEPSIAVPDLSALEYATQLARREGVEVVAVATGGEECVHVLQEAVARGAVRSVHVCSKRQATDPYETASRLCEAVRELSPSLVLCGTRSTAGMHGAVPRQLAHLLGLPFVGSVVELEVSSDWATARAVQGLEHGNRWAWEAAIPLVCGVDPELCSPRYLAVRRARRAGGHQPSAVAGPDSDVAAVAHPLLGDLTVQGRAAPRIRPKKSKVATTTMSAADRMKLLRSGGKAPAASAAGGSDDDRPKRMKGDAQKAAAEIIALLEARDVLGT